MVLFVDGSFEFFVLFCFLRLDLTVQPKMACFSFLNARRAEMFYHAQLLSFAFLKKVALVVSPNINTMALFYHINADIMSTNISIKGQLLMGHTLKIC